jgi:hypothetical protein
MARKFSKQSGESYMPKPGEKILVQTEVKAGAFPDERLVTVSTSTGTISGFAKADAIVDRGGGTYIVGEVKTVTGSNSIVKLNGSFFTTTGIASIPNARILKAAG